MVFVTHWPKNIGKKFPAEIKLDRVLEVCSRLENPHLKIPPVIHVSGTNGKGSVVSYITNILINAGFKVHKYISPHLIEFNERIILNGNNIDDEYLFDIIERTRRAAELRPVISGPNSGLTLFEATTIASFIAFSEVKADFLVMEVGMGGRVDPTNIVENKILSIITPVALDHQDFLGETEEIIAHEKCGIIKKNIPIISGPQREDVMKVIEYHARINQSPIYRYGYEFCSSFNYNEKYFSYIKQGLNQEKTLYPIPSLRGPHQIENASVAVAASEILNKRYDTNIFYEDICDSLIKTFWPARLQKIDKGRIKNLAPKNWEIYLDGAHNASGASVLKRWIDEYAKNRDVYVIFGTTRGKDVKPYLMELKEEIRFICSVCVFHETNAYLGSEIFESIQELQMDGRAFEYTPDALSFLKNEFYENLKLHERKDDSIILICGSLYLAGDVLKINQGLI